MQYSTEGKRIAYFNSIKEAARQIGCSDSTLKRAADGKRIGKGYYWILDSQNILISDLINK